MDIIAKQECLPAQIELIKSDRAHPALIGGYGSGKSMGGLFRAFDLKFKYPKNKIAIYAPTYALLRDYWFEKIEQFGDKYNLNYHLNKSDKEFHIQGYGKIILRSMDDPKSIISYEVAHSIVDEIDIFPKDKAEERWRRILARNREILPKGVKNTVCTMTTPEGYNFAYSKWKKNPAPSYQLIKARTEDNPFLPETYITDLKESFDAILLEAYLEGNFVNLKSGSIYYSYDDKKYTTKEQMELDPTIPVNICVDFNVNPMIWLICQHTDKNNIKVFYEITKRDTNTWEQCKDIKDLLPKHFDVKIYGDSTGRARDTRGIETDYIIIDKKLRPYFRSIKYEVPEMNPAVLTRVKSVNARLDKGAILIQEKCENLKEDFIQCIYNQKGEIDKTSQDRSHASDALGYYIVREFPIIIKKGLPEITAL